jgi:hypothetical protein
MHIKGTPSYAEVKKSLRICEMRCTQSMQGCHGQRFLGVTMPSRRNDVSNAGDAIS